MQDRGLGDSIERITKITGVKSVIDAAARIWEKDCGCNERKELLNKWFPYTKPVKFNNVKISRLTADNLDNTIKDIKEQFNV
tara:strand:+ start:1579 stop:1824 length:246 start_codon:yes stop_codon:yes gene_type:complete